MLATKANTKEKLLTSPKPESKKGVMEEAAPQIQLNPLWHGLATHVDSKTAAGASGDPSTIQRKPSHPTGTPHIQRMSTECEEEFNADTEAQIQTKLTVGTPDDPYEKEADAVADKVMRMPVGGNPNQLQEDAPSIQNKSLKIPPIQRLYAERTEALGEGGTPSVQRKSKGKPAKSAVPSSVSNIINSPGSGSPLNESVRSRVEPVLGADLSSVRVHEGMAAQDASHSLNAKAFTHQNRIFLGQGQSASDVALMAHEATHVMQQGKAGERIQRLGMGDFRVPSQREVDNIRSRRRAADAEAVKSADSTWDISNIQYFDTASPARRMALVDIILAEGWVGPIDESSLARIWNSFGESLGDVVGESAANTRRWNQSINRGMELSHVYTARGVRSAFERDVKALARSYMQQNLEYALREQEHLGFRVAEGGLSPTHETEQALRLEETQELARQAEVLLQQQDQLRQQTVGYQAHYEGMAAFPAYTAVSFDPNSRFSGITSYSPYPGAEQVRVSHDWRDVNEQWTQTNAALSAITVQSPAVFAAVAQGRDNVQALGSDNPEVARATAQQVLTTLESNIRNTLPKIDNGDMDWQDLVPIHQQLYGGAVQGNSGVDWSSDFAKSIARDVIGDHETSEFWLSLGLGTLAGALFIVASLATGGLATAAMIGGLAASGTQAVMSWENYDDLSTAAQAASTGETSLISQGQVDGALIQAIIDSVFFFLDVIPAARTWRAAHQLNRVMAERSAQAALRHVAEGGEAAAHALQRGISELGVRETMEQTGKSLDEMATILRSGLGEEASAPLLRRLDEAGQMGLDTLETAAETGLRSTGTAAENSWVGARSVQQVAADVPAAIQAGTLSREFGDQLVAEAIERIGPAEVVRESGGWAVLARALTDESAAGQRLIQWRRAVFDDLERFVIDVADGQVQRTGTTGRFSNDIDMSFIGPNASEVRQQAMEYLARRLGVDNSPQAFDRTLMAGLFTDPTRAHAYDVLPGVIRETMAQRQAAFQEQLIWNRRVYEALEAGDAQMAESIRDMMRQQSIPEFAYRPLSSGDVARLSRRMDRIHGELLQAAERSDLVAQERLAAQLVEGQALINAAEGGGYYSSGGVRRWVSERPGEAPFERIGGRSAAEMSTPMVERLTALLDQLPKLDEGRFLLLSRSADEIVGGVRSIGKYGERMMLMGAELRGRYLPEEWSQLILDCMQLKRAADSGEVAARVSAAEAREIVAQAQSTFYRLSDASTELLRDMRVAAQLPDIGNAAARIQTMTTAHVRLLRAIDLAMEHYNIILRALHLGVQLSEISDTIYDGSEVCYQPEDPAEEVNSCELE